MDAPKRLNGTAFTDPHMVVGIGSASYSYPFLAMAERERTIVTAIGIGLDLNEALAIVDFMSRRTAWNPERMRAELRHRTKEQLNKLLAEEVAS